MTAAPQVGNAQTPTVNGLYYGDADSSLYFVVGAAIANRGVLYAFATPDTVWALMLVDTTVNDNAFGDNQGAGPDGTYMDTVGWNPGHSLGKLYGSDHNQWSVLCQSPFSGADTTYAWSQDMLDDVDGDADPSEADWYSDHLGADGLGNAPPGIRASSSIAYNMNNTSWDVTLGGSRTSLNTYKSPDFLPNDTYPFYDAALDFEWEVAYEIAIPRSSCNFQPITLWVVSAHNSPSKDGDENVEVCNPAVQVCDPIRILLPVELVTFDATLSGKRAELTWTTASETGNAGFEVQYSQGDESEFETIGFVEGAGTTTRPRFYGYTVSDLDFGQHRFRLRQIDFDGAFALSEVVEVSVTEIPGAFVLQDIYPNPFNPTATVTFGVAVEQPVEIILFDALGRQLKTLYRGTPAEGTLHKVTLNGVDLPSGVYQVQMRGGGRSETKIVTLLK